MIETKIVNEYDGPVVVTNETEMLEQEATLALALIERWGMVAAIEDGEDSAGRAKSRLSRPEELVERAFTVASLAMMTAREKGLVHVAPTLAEMDVEAGRAKAEKEEGRRAH